MAEVAPKARKISVRLNGEDQERFNRLQKSLSPARPKLIEVSDVIRYALELACQRKFADQDRRDNVVTGLHPSNHP